LTADDELHVQIAQANAVLNEDGSFAEELVMSRQRGGDGEPVLAEPSDIDYMDVSPRQMVSAATALIPFLEHDDANRALMDANMQRLAVPVIESEAPLVGTGIENPIAIDAGDSITAQKTGVVTEVAGDMVTVMEDVGSSRHYPVYKFQRSNTGNAYNQVVR